MFWKKHNEGELEGLKPVERVSFKTKLSRFIKKYDFLLLQKDIESYGFEYSFKKFVIALVSYIALTVGVAVYIHLKSNYIGVLIGAVALMIPFLIRAQFGQRYQIARFDTAATYMDNMIPLFKKYPSIVRAWGEILDLLEGDMLTVVTEAYELVSHNTDDPNVYQTAFNIIEESFPNSRIHSVHQMMYSIETRNTVNYSSAIDNVWFDVQQWIMRVANFHKELSKKRTDLMMVSLLTLLSNCLFSSMYAMSEVFEGYTDNVVYQTSSTLFLIGLMLTICIFQIKLTGIWLLDDKTEGINKKAMRSFRIITEKGIDGVNRKSDKIIAVITVAAGVVIYFKVKNILVLGAAVFVAYMIYNTAKRNYLGHMGNIRKFLEMEFPVWVRDISINLQNLTVINSIEQSKETSSVILCYYINKLLDGVYENPSSIKPFNDFLKEFKINGVHSSMKILYSMQSLGKEDIAKQTNDMVIRNQEMLARAEKIKNESAVANLKLLGFIPVLILVAQMLVSMALLFTFILNFMSASAAI